MEIAKENRPSWLELKLEGRLDAYRAGHLESELEEVIRNGNHHLLLNMKAISFISSAGIRVLIKYYQMTHSLGGGFGVVEPSEATRSVLKLAGLSALMVDGETQAAPKRVEPEPGLGQGPAEESRDFGDLACTIHVQAPGSRLRGRLLGEPRRLESAGFPDQGVATLRVNPDSVALGLGALGEAEESKTRMGEFLAAGGAAICLPSDGAKVPDYVVATGALLAEVRALYAVALEGALSHCIRFSHKTGAPAPLSQLVQIAFDVVRAKTVGFAMLAESSGLVGASLRRSPMLATPDQSFFAHPGVRRWLSFTSERVYDRSLALVVGLASCEEIAELSPFVRPIGASPLPLGHFHAAAFNYKALPKGSISIGQTIPSLLEDRSLLGVLHLINDTRDIQGSGESQFLRGAMWVGPVDSFAQEAL